MRIFKVDQESHVDPETLLKSMPQDPLPDSSDVPKPPVTLEYSGPTTGKQPIDILQLIVNLVTIPSFGIITIARGHGILPIGLALAMKSLSPSMPMNGWFHFMLALAGSGFVLLIGGGFSRQRRIRQRLTLGGLVLLTTCLVMMLVESEFTFLTIVTAFPFCFFVILSLINLFLPENEPIAHRTGRAA